MKNWMLYIFLVFFSGLVSAQETEDSLVLYGDQEDEEVILEEKGVPWRDTLLVFSTNDKLDGELLLSAEKNSVIKIRNQSGNAVDVVIRDIDGCKECVNFISEVSVGNGQMRELKFSFQPDGNCKSETCSLLLSNHPKGREKEPGAPLRLKLRFPERSMNMANKVRNIPKSTPAAVADIEVQNVEPTQKMTLMDYFIIAILVLSISAVAVISRLRQDFKQRLDELQNSQNELGAAVQAMKVPTPVNAAPVIVSTEEMERKLADLRDEVQRMTDENRDVLRKIMERMGGS